MIVPQYTPGPWATVVSDGRVVMVEGGDPADLWASVRAGAGFADQLALLTRRGFGALPGFALLDVRGGLVHVVLRGPVVAEVATAAGPRVLAARDVETWSEQVVEDARGVELRVEGGGGDGRRGPWWPVLAGVVGAGAVSVRLTPAREREPMPEPVREALPEPAFPREPEPLPTSTSAPTSAPAPRGDHDGTTVLRAELDDVLGGEAAFLLPPALPAAAPLRWCVEVSTGEVVELDRTVLIGRAPQARRVAGPELPRLVTVPSPQHDVSRTHAEVRCEGQQVLVTDLGSTNGTLVLRDGRVVRRLHPGEPTVVEPGAVVDIGDGVTFTVAPLVRVP